MSREHRSCRACIFWQELAETPDGVLMGECRAYPPRPGMTSERETRGDTEDLKFIPVWPATEADEWCGAYTSDSMGPLMFMNMGGKIN